MTELTARAQAGSGKIDYVTETSRVYRPYFSVDLDFQLAAQSDDEKQQESCGKAVLQRRDKMEKPRERARKLRQILVMRSSNSDWMVDHGLTRRPLGAKTKTRFGKVMTCRDQDATAMIKYNARPMLV